MNARAASLLALLVAGPALAAEPEPRAAAQVSAIGSYRLTGERNLRPARISDDGYRTFIEWAEEQPLPAVFAISAMGREEIVNGFMRDGVFTIDRVDAVLVFRIDQKWARATRLPSGSVR